jgi:hypothetical protein
MIQTSKTSRVVGVEGLLLCQHRPAREFTKCRR